MLPHDQRRHQRVKSVLARLGKGAGLGREIPGR